MSFDTTKLPIGKCLLKVIDNRGKTPPLSDVKTPHGLIEINALVGQNKHPDYKVIRKFVSAETYGSWFRSGHPKDGDVLFSTVGSIAEVAIICGGKGCIAQNLIALRTNPAIVNSDYFYYALINPDVQAKLRTLDISSVQPSIKVPHLLATEIPLISLSLQKEVVVVLSALDDRITLLRETNATLEAIAQALYKSWFVDFDPVRAKLEGRAPEGMDEATVALFPDEFEESELGSVPRGWKSVRLDSILELAYGKALKAEQRKQGSVPVYGSGGITGWHDTALVSHPSIVVGRKGTVGSLFWESRPFFPIDTVFYAKSKLPLTYCFELLRTMGLSDMNTDAAVPGLNRENAYRLLIPDAPKGVVAAFDSVVGSVRQQIDHNAEQTQTLATLRDTLLPRLISGQLRLPEFESLTEESVA